MTLRRLVAMTALIALLTAGLVMPRRAEASTATDALIIAGVAVVGYLVVLFTVTALKRSPTPTGEFTDAPILTSRQPREPGERSVQLGFRCPQSGSDLTWVCW